MKIGAVLLAAGSSRRFGPANKLLALIDGKTIIRSVAAQLLRSDADEIVVVTGPEREAIMAALDGLPLRFVHNAGYLEGMGRSIAVGVAALSPEIDGTLVMPGDMPHVSVEIINAVVAAFAAEGHVTYPVTSDGRQGNPVLWPRSRFPDLLCLSGDKGAKSLLSAGEFCAVSITDDQALIDIDTPEDLHTSHKT